MSEVFDFCSRFTADYLTWCQKHPEISSDEEKLEAVFPRQYEKWYSSPKSWLDNKSPNQYFEEIEDAQVYASMYVSYLENDMELPEPLIVCMIHQKEEIYPILRNILLLDGSRDISEEDLSDVRAHIIQLFTEMQKEHPIRRYIELLRDSKENDTLTQEICTILEESENPDEVRGLLLDAYSTAKTAGRECILDLLCGMPDTDGRAFDLLSDEFRYQELEPAFLAGLAGKLGDERLLDELRTLLNDDGNDYFTHTAVRYAIEELTGELLPEKDFSGDPDYDLLTSYTEDTES